MRETNDHRPLHGSRGRRLCRRHVLMLSLAAEVLVLGLCGAGTYRPPGVVVEQTLTHGHVIT